MSNKITIIDKDENTIVLTDRDEIEDLIGEEISDDVWLDIKVQLARHKGMWQAIDEAIHEIVT